MLFSSNTHIILNSSSSIPNASTMVTEFINKIVNQQGDDAYYEYNRNKKSDKKIRKNNRD